MSDRATSSIRTVVGVYSEQDGIVVVRIGTGSAHVTMIPNSAIPTPGDGILVVDTDRGLAGVCLPPLAVPDVLTLNYTLDAAVGPKNAIMIDFDCTILAVTLLSDTSGNYQVDIEETDYSGFSASFASICASALPTLTAAYKYQDGTLTGWAVDIAAGSILRCNVLSSDLADTAQVTLALKLVRV